MVKSRARGSRGALTRKANTRRERLQTIAEMVDMTAGAKRIADGLGEKFLAYLLAMAIQEMSAVEARLVPGRRATPSAHRPEPD